MYTVSQWQRQDSNQDLPAFSVQTFVASKPRKEDGPAIQGMKEYKKQQSDP